MVRVAVSAFALAAALAAAAPSGALAQAQANGPAAPAAVSEDARFNAFLDSAFDARLALSPQAQTSLGLKTSYDRLNDYTPAADERSYALLTSQYAAMTRDFAYDRLSPAAQVSWRLFEDQAKRAERNRRWNNHGFLFTANGSPAGSLPVFLINNHRVATVEDARAYVARLTEVERVGTEIADDFRRRAKAGIVPPQFVFEPATADARAVLAGAPFSAGADTPVWADFKAKVAKLDAPEATKAELLSAGEQALTGPFRRGYDAMLASLSDVSKLATSNDGVWRLSNGDAYYADRVRDSTTTDLTPDQVHEIGLKEVARIQREMEAIKRQVGFEGSLQDFFRHVKTDARFKYPNTPEGREAYLADARAAVADAMREAPRFFHRLPKAPLEVRAVEPWREKTASVAFYSRGTPDGSRPGIYYVNLSDMTQVLKPQVEMIAYHEGAPGHHFQSSFAQEQEGLPKFRRFGGYGAYGEGWGLYSEQLGKELGLYKDPYSDFGRLSGEIWRAARLVVDTGLHKKRWSREKATQYFRDNTLVSELDIQREIDRYITNPGQATSYKIGHLKIVELREKAKAALGPKFDIRDYHAAVLDDGALPLSVLEQQVDAYIARRKAG